MNLTDNTASSRTRRIAVVVTVLAALAVAGVVVSRLPGTKAKPVAPAAAQAPKGPVPPPQEAQGAAAAEVSLPAQPAALKARISGMVQAVLQEGGSVQILVFADGRQCNGKRYPRESFMGPDYALTMACEVDVRAGAPANFRAELSVDKGTSGPLKLRVEYGH